MDPASSFITRKALPRGVWRQQFCFAARVWNTDKCDLRSLIKVGKWKEKKTVNGKPVGGGGEMRLKRENKEA